MVTEDAHDILLWENVCDFVRERSGGVGGDVDRRRGC